MAVVTLNLIIVHPCRFNQPEEILKVSLGYLEGLLTN